MPNFRFLAGLEVAKLVMLARLARLASLGRLDRLVSWVRLGK